MLLLPLVAFALTHGVVPGSAENSIRLKKGSAKLTVGSAGVRTYQATMETDESMLEMVELIVGIEDTMVFTKYRSEKRAGSEVWSGIHASTNTPASFLTVSRNLSGRVSGSLKTANTTYSLLTLANGDLVVTATDRSIHKFVPPAEVEGIDKKAVPDVMNGKYRNGGIELLKQFDVRSHKAGLSSDVTFGSAASMLKRKRQTSLEPNQRDLQTVSVADVMVLVTNEAMCQSAGLSPGCPLTDENAAPIVDYLQTITETEVNQGMQAVGANSGIEMVSIAFLPEDFNVLKPDVQSLVFVDQSCAIRDIRVQENADLVAVITGDNTLENSSLTLGIAEINGFASVTGLFGLLNTFTFTHEIGHSYGCFHDRPSCAEIGNEPFHPYAHGFQLVPFHRTVMAYQCELDLCPQELPFFSTPDLTFDDLPIGDEDHNNVRQLNDAALDVSRRSVTATCSSGESQPTAPPTASPIECDPSNPFCSIADLILQLINLIALIFGSG